MALIEGMTAVVVGSVFGGIFVIACFISSIKAVRDRRRLKRKIAAKAKQHIEIEEGRSTPNDNVTTPTTSNGVSNSKPPTVSAICDQKNLIDDGKQVTDGIYNVSFISSNGDVKSTGDAKSNMRTGTLSDQTNPLKSRTLPVVVNRSNNREKVSHLSSECLAVQKITRRYSYEVAVAEHSWLPVEPPCFASSERIINTYRYGVNDKPRRSVTVGYENKAYEGSDGSTFRLTQKL